MLETVKHPLRGRTILSLLIINSTYVLLLHAAAFPDWTDCPVVCSCKWTSGKKSAFCQNAGLSSLPASLDQEMQVLDLSGNNIPELQDQIFKRNGLVNLQKVFLRNAGIHEIHADAFKDMGILIEVDLSDNHVASLEVNTFNGNERLRVLILTGNPLVTLVSHQFPTLKHLKTLELQRCGLTKVHSLTFANLPNLESLKLDNNQLTYLDATTISSLSNLKTLTLEANKWSCDCRLKSFRNWLIPDTPKKIYSVPQICNGPSRLEGRRWEDVKPSDFACAPQVKVYASPMQEEVNGNLSLSCLISGDPVPEFWWQLNGGFLNLSRSTESTPYAPLVSYIVTFTSSAEFNHYRADGKLPERWNNITIYNASDSDAGEYTCQARNIAGAAKDTINIVVPRVFTAPTLSQTDNWLLWVTLAGGGTAALFASISAVLMVLCLCGGSRRRTRHEKVKLQGSTSFGDQEKKLLDLSVTTTGTSGCNTNERISGQGSLADTCSPGDLELAERTSICDATTVTVERLRPDCGGTNSTGLRNNNVTACSTTGFLPPPPEFTGGVLPSGIYGNIFISVALPQDVERCYPDLLDIPVHAPTITDKSNFPTPLPATSMISSFATLPRRPLRTDLGSQYDNMGPRVTATGSSTFSLTDDLRLSPPPPPLPVIKPPIEFVSL